MSLRVTSANSSVNLKGEFSKPRLRGEQDKMNPKSICMMWPSLSKRMFPLCLKINGKKKKHLAPPPRFHGHFAGDEDFTEILQTKQGRTNLFPAQYTRLLYVLGKTKIV